MMRWAIFNACVALLNFLILGHQAGFGLATWWNFGGFTASAIAAGGMYCIAARQEKDR